MTDNSLLFLFNWIIIAGIILLAIANLRRFANENIMFSISTKTFVIFGIVGGTFCIISADYYNYTQMLDRLKTWSMSDEVEPIYWVLAKYVEYKVFYFRALILFVYYLIFSLLVKQLSIPKTIVYNFFIVYLFLIVTTILRSSAADAIMWLGIFYFFRHRGFWTYICLLILCSIGIVAHKSSFMVILLFALSYIPLKKAFIQFSILSIPVAVLIIRMIVPIIFAKFFE
ncbi:MAG: EpsG family protein [Bacilli bacterium]|nr:EpsG family protein [Bacilli bacterium]